jgi:hypothetical protein
MHSKRYHGTGEGAAQALVLDDLWNKFRYRAMTCAMALADDVAREHGLHIEDASPARADGTLAVPK